MGSAAHGRFTDGYDGPLVVFLIGMRVNKPLRVRSWWPVFTTMPKLLAELHREKALADAGKGPDNGFLGHRLLLGAGGPSLVQYWRSVDDVYGYASSTDHGHRPAWTAFNAAARRSGGAVGIWHETFAVPDGGHETIYVDMPAYGLAAATSMVPIGRRADRARDRMATRVS